MIIKIKINKCLKDIIGLNKHFNCIVMYCYTLGNEITNYFWNNMWFRSWKEKCESKDAKEALWNNAELQWNMLLVCQCNTIKKCARKQNYCVKSMLYLFLHNNGVSTRLNNCTEVAFILDIFSSYLMWVCCKIPQTNALYCCIGHFCGLFYGVSNLFSSQLCNNSFLATITESTLLNGCCHSMACDVSASFELRASKIIKGLTPKHFLKHISATLLSIDLTSSNLCIYLHNYDVITPKLFLFLFSGGVFIH